MYQRSNEGSAENLQALSSDLVEEQASGLASAQAAQRGEGEAAPLAAPQDANLGDPILDAARLVAFLPVVQGGLGLRSSALLSPAAHWAAWADVLPIVVERVPDLADRVLQELDAGDSQVHCVAQALAAEAAVTRPEFP